MLISSLLRALSLVPCALVLPNVSASSLPWSKRADGLNVEFPEGGESYTTGVDIDIAWIPSSSGGENARLELKKGAVDRLSTVHLITSETENNGTYQWRSREDGFLRALISEDLPNAPPSACDYVISVRVDKTTAHSGYFTIINVNDDGLPDDAQCPDVKAPPPPSAGNNEDDKGGDGDNSKEEDNSSGDGEPSSSNDSNSGTSGTVTTAMLGGAVGGAAGGLVLIFSAILLIGRSRGWFVDDEYIEKRVSAAVINIVQGNENVKSRLVQEVTEAREIASQPIHQLEA